MSPWNAQVKVEQLASDWKALDVRLRESLQAPPPSSAWMQHHSMVQHQQLGTPYFLPHFLFDGRQKARV